MNRRIKRKVTITLVAKILAKSIKPEIKLKANRVEKKMFKRHQAFVKYLVVEGYKDYLKTKKAEMT